MLKFGVTIRKKRPDRNKMFNVEISIYHQGATTFFLTGFKVRKDQFRNGMVTNHEAADQINTSIQLQTSAYIERYISAQVDLSRLTIRQIRCLLLGDKPDKIIFDNLINQKIKECEAKGVENSRGLYVYTRNTMNKYSPGITLNEIDFQFLIELETYLNRMNISVNTVAAIFRYIRIIFNTAIDNELISPDTYPFRKFKIKTEKTMKRNLTIDELRRLRTIDHPAVDIFMLSFYLIGINLKDILYAKHTQLDACRLNYNRFKTKRLYSIKIEPEASRIINKYKGVKLLVNFMESRKRLDQFTKWINKHLRTQSASKGINKHVPTSMHHYLSPQLG